MRRALSTVALAAAALTAVAAPAPAATAPAGVRVAGCSVQDHEATFRARMRLVEGASRMAMRFTLLRETAEDHAEAIKAPTLGRWRRSDDGVLAFRYEQGFRRLPENATYRVRVQFRWYAPSGEVVARAARRSAPCRQFDELPNLAIRLTRSDGIFPGVWRYEGVVTNEGEGPATDVPVRFSVDGDVVDTLTVASLAPGERRSVVLRGPRCRRRATLVVDPQQSIAETTDEDNLFKLDCSALRAYR